MIFGTILKQLSCIEQMACFPENLMDVFSFFNHQYGMPNAVTLGLFLGILVGGIYIQTRSAVMLAILGIYTVTIVSATWANEAMVAPAYHGILWIIALAIASIIVVAILKVTRE